MDGADRGGAALGCRHSYVVRQATREVCEREVGINSVTTDSINTNQINAMLSPWASSQKENWFKKGRSSFTFSKDKKNKHNGMI